VAVLGLCFLVIFLDGFDTAAVGFVAPALSAAWKVPPPEMKQLLTVGFLGLAVGSLAAGPIADRFGRKWVLVGALAAFGGFSLASAGASDLTGLTALRFLTGLGLGAAMPNATTLTAEYCPKRRRALLVTLMFSGFTLGSAGGGFVAAGLMPHFGWQSVFVVGGLAPLVLALVLAAVLPESLQFLALRGGARQQVMARLLGRIDPTLAIGPQTRFVISDRGNETRGSVGLLFEESLGVGTVALWTAFFMGLVVVYLLTSWLPTLMSTSGVGIEKAALVGAMFQLGGTLGALAVGWCMDRLSPHLSVAASYLLGAAMLLVLAGEPSNVLVLGGAVFFAGFFMSGAQTSLQPLAAIFYPTRGRATGVSWMVGIGRFGAILGAYLGGVLLGLGAGFQTIIGVLALPAAIAAVAVLLKHWRYAESAPPPAVSPIGK